MPFANYGSIGDVAQVHLIRWLRGPFVEPVARPFGESFRSELEITLSEVPFDNSEAAACESLIYPTLREAWKSYRGALTLWSHQPIRYDDDLSGTPDFLLARRSPLGASILDKPYLMVVEAKRDDFPGAWGQCLAAMLASQKLNDLADQAVYGITTNGRGWEFGRLQGRVFTQEVRPFSLLDLDALAAALHFVMSQCRDQAARQPALA